MVTAPPLFFVYIRWCGKVHAQLWYGEPTDGNGKPNYKQEQIVFKKKLSEDESRMSFEQLKNLFPMPELKDE